ncbi:DUF6507 family protein [Streptomyces clavuligerus]|uniref:Uncharacterized protein n=1 Tax=Streptomyces clavuligerus TaxID=1901 RepID=B5H216_STRCL|nr:DUF6507 family protein [Streptomyces clavuligerus]ANW20098.1 hypothetical protein BB341_18710 [Streptomyces clavuligerus]AXU14724.1 hypothetical protein D1794_19530 [Streptomyces clavuligerus]EDY52612.1 hypothetical protein SSCG_05640 [Streptomyces clavuligerus]EFG06999.1 Hypothetical protein SCLAV_1926 [Streptomyces clavuligerus]MBY6304749.1 hypothetical protein [Streptomyces clavuligerus]
MTGWDIQPQGVQGQLKIVSGHAGDLQKALEGLVGTVTDAASAAGTAVPGSAAGPRLHGPVAPGRAPLRGGTTMGPVAAALGEYLSGRQKDFNAMAERIEACVLGAAKATNEYVEGDLEAAREAQEAARSLNLEALRRELPGGGGR